ncbi:dihydrodipicolinate synthase family protein [Croceicoccus bisphenolivorans]|uniref:dihydrodipicolinate synthase family protein n=1 Tax=Croceicoccus bisphenolivorans TaxID=1783232 RepID=UPI000837008B|nr:dihydrodipicolinate synthase family protein [Croceicoccus bisphenolivorans]
MGSLPQISVDDIKGVVAYQPTTVRTDIVIDRNTRNAVDLDEAARAADVLVRDGASAIVLNGTFGELASLSLDEIMDFTRAVVESVKDRVPVFAGATTLNTRETIERARKFREMGAHGLNLGRGMLSAMDDVAVVEWYKDITEEFPDMAVMLYDDAQAFKRPITTPVYRELAKMPQIVACKYRTVLVISNMIGNGTYNADFEAVGGRIKLLTQETDWPIVNRMFGVDACWSSYINCAPGFVMAVRDAVLAGELDRAQAMIDESPWPGDKFSTAGGPDSWHMNKIMALKTRIHHAGYIKAGPPLPPYHVAPAERGDTARELAMLDREMQKKYPHRTALEAVA